MKAVKFNIYFDNYNVSIMRGLFILIISIIIPTSQFISGCASTNKSKTAIEKPSWMEARPVNPLYYYGIGSAIKTGTTDYYRNQARENALSEIAGLINTHISSNMVLYKVEDKFGVHEMLQNRVKAESKEFLEGYEYIDQWEDKTRYYTIYRLEKSVYERNKEQRKKTAIEGALLKYQQAVDHLHGKRYLVAYSFFSQTLENIKDYLQESVVIKTPQGYQIDLVNGSLTYMDEILQELHIKANYNNITITGEEPDKNLTFIITDKQNNPVAGIPVKFNYSGGFLIKDTGKSDGNGIINSPEIKAPVKSAREILTASIDVQEIARNATFDLDIRQMLGKWNSAYAKVQIEFVR